MRYVFVNYTYSPGFNTPEGWFKRIEGYLGFPEGLSRDNVVILINQVDYEGSCLHKGVQHYFIRSGNGNNYAPFKLNRFVTKLNPDVVIIQGLHHPLQLIQLKFLLNTRVKVIAQHHAEKPFTGLKKYIQRLADKSVDAYLFASYNMGLEWVRKGIISSANKIREVMEVSSNFYPIDKVEAQLKTGAQGNKIFLWVGRLNENKDPLNVVSAFLKYAETNALANLYMIYHTDELLAGVQQLVSHHPNKTAVKLIGKVPHNELLYWFNSADFFLSGSHYEGSGTAVCEAMSCGCIPVVTDIFSFRMITDNGNCGLLYKAGDQDDLLSALTLTDRMEIADKRTKALAYFKGNLSFEAIAVQVHKIASSF